MTDSAAYREPATGEVLGSYRLGEVLGRGGMGTVFAAVHQHIGKRAAVKVLDPRLLRHAEMRARFLTEARAVNRVGHPALVDIFEFGAREDGALYIIMELLVGVSLSERLRAHGARPYADALRVAQQAALALAAAHRCGVIHRDLKPGNIMLVPDPLRAGEEQVKLLDFGIAKVLSEQAGEPEEPAGLTRTGAVLGTPAYMAPEQCRGTPVSDRSDVYALGVILYQMIAGELPFAAPLAFDLMNLHVHSSPPALRGKNPQVPAGLAELVHVMLGKEPGRRPSMEEVLAALLRHQDAWARCCAEPPPAPPPVSEVPVDAPTLDAAAVAALPAPASVSVEVPVRRRWPAVLGGGLVLVAPLLWWALRPAAPLVSPPEVRRPAPVVAPVDMAAPPRPLVDMAAPSDLARPAPERRRIVPKPPRARPAGGEVPAPMRNQDVPLLGAD